MKEAIRVAQVSRERGRLCFWRHPCPGRQDHHRLRQQGCYLPRPNRPRRAELPAKAALREGHRHLRPGPSSTRPRAVSDVPRHVRVDQGLGRGLRLPPAGHRGLGRAHSGRVFTWRSVRMEPDELYESLLRRPSRHGHRRAASCAKSAWNVRRVGARPPGRGAGPLAQRHVEARADRDTVPGYFPEAEAGQRSRQTGRQHGNAGAGAAADQPIQSVGATGDGVRYRGTARGSGPRPQAGRTARPLSRVPWRGRAGPLPAPRAPGPAHRP